MHRPNMAVEVAGIKMRNPVMPASGCFGFGEEYAHFMDLNALGAIVVKSVTLRPTMGNKPPRVCETPAGMLNSIAWQNPGLDIFLKEKLPFLRQFQTPVIVNLAGKTAQEYGDLAGELEGIKGLAGLELNISCPNVEEGGVAFGTDPVLAAQVTAAVKKRTTLPLIVKLSPNVTDITKIAAAVESAGADAISLINAFTGMAIDIRTRRPVLGNITGGLTGPAIKPVALYMVWRVAQTVKVPVIGIGGILRAEDAIEYILAGARAVAVGLGTFIQPTAMLDVIRGIEDYLQENGIDDVNDLVGKLRTD
ncbi:dihydroorotate dehydrogenase [Candidatus Formimonas warabiya]|uniref:Dihydroorotate dehydrogenase n=1 Tax=Formimonas warabiya TaxID=1761012 RepID=A0A3G1KXK6_FORW1|nr:dihydroorotate dehydrogenase [Candidatus Formimonas warabiya]ATW27172.1 dihydroorotate dehydrogenase B catalytic subunit [Candidatus Formimonas warabiya]